MTNTKPGHEPADRIKDNILEVSRLGKHFRLRKAYGKADDGRYATVKAVDDVSFQLGRGEILGLVGESGCGKTTLGKLIMKLIAPDAGQISVAGYDVTALAGKEEIAYRRQVQMIFQDPYASMNPRFKVRDVLEEPLLIHGIGATQAERLPLIAAAMEKVKMLPVSDYIDRHPHMLSGGQRQRIATARTLILSPRIIIADEPVSMIDLSTRAELLHMLKNVQQAMELSFLYITHDISTARYFTDRIAIMYLGRIVECGTADEVIDRPLHPYTRALISAVCEPVAGRLNRRIELPIRGEIPNAAHLPAGCRFHPRCPCAVDECSTSPEPGLVPVAGADVNHLAACRRTNLS